MDGTSRIDELEQKFIENPRRYFAPLANEYRKAGNPHQAIAICRAHLGQLPGHMSGQIVYGQALFEGGEFDEAKTVFENALAMDRENLVALRHLGDLALRNGETAAARQFYAKLLEIDPKDAPVVSLVNEIDSASEAQASTTDTEPPSNEESVADEEPAPPATAPAPPADTFHSDEEDKLMAEELGFPLPPPHAFVTETMAELYLAQGFRDRAVGVYRELLSHRPEDERLKSRLSEIEHGSEAPVEESRPEEQPVSEIQPEEMPIIEAQPDEAPLVEARREEETSVENPAEPAEEERQPSVEAPPPSAPDIEPPSEEIPTDDTSAVDSPPAENDTAEPDSVEAAISVREFFAGIGRRRPIARTNGSSNGSPYNSGGSGSGEGSDARAAAALAGAFGQSSSAPAATSAVASPAVAATGKESEEDVARFRAWLDGLTT